jgi:hypothetical protein
LRLPCDWAITPFPDWHSGWICATVGELAVGDESGDLAHALIIEGAIMEELIRRLDKQANEIQLQLVTIRDLRSKLLETADEINGKRLGY